MKKTVVSFADGAGNYAKALMRLEHSLKAVGFNGDFKGYNDYAHIESKQHKTAPDAVPYQFKAMAIDKAIKEGATMLLWCDSVVYATKSIDPIFEQIKNDGYIFFDNIGYSIGDYTSDACLHKFRMGRAEAFETKMIMACVMGFDLSHPKAIEFLNRYIEASKDDVSYPGAWSNNNLEVSNDMRVKGHRHDQSVASIIIKQMNLKITNAQERFFAYTSHKGIVKIADTVCLWSEGI